MTDRETLITWQRRADTIWTIGFAELSFSAAALLATLTDAFTIRLATVHLFFVWLVAMVLGLLLLGTSSAISAVVYHAAGYRRLAAFHLGYVGVVVLGFVLLASSGIVATAAGLVMVVGALIITLTGSEWWSGPGLYAHLAGSALSVLAPYFPWSGIIVIAAVLWAGGLLVVAARIALISKSHQ